MNPVQYEKDGAGMIGAILLTTFTLSVLMGALFYRQYSKVLSYVRITLDEPDGALVWDERPHSPDECIGAALDWVAGCDGIKSMCDMYVDRLIAMCMGSRVRTDYCDAIDASTTQFGHQECSVRSVRRNVDAEACSRAYRAIDSFCDSLEYPDPPDPSDE
jgi:hypothetical protein